MKASEIKCMQDLIRRWNAFSEGSCNSRKVVGFGTILCDETSLPCSPSTCGGGTDNCIPYNKSIHNMARERIELNKDKRYDRFVRDCIEAGICPNCGGNLTKTNSAGIVLDNYSCIVCPYKIAM
jgi:hypothetical protein